MATSVIEICNNALTDLGQDAIASLTDTSKAARLCNQRWPSVRDAVLRAHTWNCCLALATLAARATTPAWKWAYCYPLPADLLRLAEVAGVDGWPVERWEVLGRELHADAPGPLAVSYVRRETDPVRYDALLTEVLSARMAAVLAFPLTASNAASQAQWAIYDQKLLEARGVNAREGGRAQQAQASGTWLAAKLGGM